MGKGGLWNSEGIRRSSNHWLYYVSLQTFFADREARHVAESRLLNLADYEQRSLDDCYDKLDHIVSKNNWRVAGRGRAWCEERYMPTALELSSFHPTDDVSVQDVSGKLLGSDDHDVDVDGNGKEVLGRLMKVPGRMVIVDTRVRDSWYGIKTREVLDGWRNGRIRMGDGGFRDDELPAGARREAARRKIVKLAF